MGFEPIALLAGSVLLFGGAAFAVFLGVYSERLERSRHQETSAHQ
jgi:hypothetical protein